MHLRYKIPEGLTYVHTHLWKHYPDQGRKCPSLPKVSSRLLCHACAPLLFAIPPLSTRQLLAHASVAVDYSASSCASYAWNHTLHVCQLPPVSISILQFIRVVGCVSSSFLLAVRLNHFLSQQHCWLLLKILLWKIASSYSKRHIHFSRKERAVTFALDLSLMSIVIHDSRKNDERLTSATVNQGTLPGYSLSLNIIWEFWRKCVCQTT